MGTVYFRWKQLFLKESLFLSVLENTFEIQKRPFAADILQGCLGLATRTHAQKKEERKERQLLPSEKQALFPPGVMSLDMYRLGEMYKSLLYMELP